MKLEKNKNLDQEYGVVVKAPDTESEDVLLSSRCHLLSLTLGTSFNILQPHGYRSLTTEFLGGSEKAIHGKVLYAPKRTTYRSHQLETHTQVLDCSVHLPKSELPEILRIAVLSFYILNTLQTCCFGT